MGGRRGLSYATAQAPLMDDDSLTYLLRGGHIDVPTRISRGIWPHQPLSFDALARHVARVLKREGSFPAPFIAAKAGESVREGIVIERRGPFHYVCHAQRHDALDPTRLAAKSERRFFSAHAAAKHYLRWNLNLPGDLDGWEVR
jgi:hypothetical protein